jgi:tRNA1(Val) A37 N6-methylase TrmN6
MEIINELYSLNPTGGFPLSTDSMVLADFVRLPKNASVLDLGSGCGTLGLLLCARDLGCTVTGLELDPCAHAAALENIRHNRLDGRLHSICADLRSMPLNPGSFRVCVSNPPYFSGGERHSRNPDARREDTCQPEELFEAAAKALRYGGDFFLVHKPERLAQLIGCGAKQGLEAKRLLLLRHKQERDISLIFLSFRKGGKPGLIIEEESLFDRNGQPTDFYRSVYHL